MSTDKNEQWCQSMIKAYNERAEKLRLEGRGTMADRMEQEAENYRKMLEKLKND